MLFIKSQKGFSLIEAVVGMVLLAILVGAVLTVTMGDKTAGRKNLTFNASCKAEAQRLMSEFKGKGLIRDHYSFPSQAAAPAGPGGALPAPGTHVVVPIEPSADEVGLNFADRWTDAGSADVINTPFTTGDPSSALAADLTILRPYTLIMGTITALETIHNNFPAVCTAPGMLATSAPAPLSTIFPNPFGVEDSAISNTGLFNPDAYLYIRMFDTATGAPFALDPCGGTHDHVAMPNSSPTGMLNVFPPGMNSGVNYPPGVPVPGMRIGQIHSGPPAVRFNAGYEVTITIDYDGRDGTRPSCSVTEKFQYPLNMADPTRPLLLRDLDLPDENAGADDFDTSEAINSFIPTAMPTTSPSVAASIDWGANGGTSPFLACNDANPRTLNFRVANARPGSVFMCRNLTRQRSLNDTAGLNTHNITTITANRHRLNVLTPRGLRQSFYSSELNQNTTSYDNDDTSVTNADRPAAGPNAFGFRQFNGLYYPFGSYFCDTTANCPNLPRFNTQGTALTIGNYDVYFPSRHSSQLNTPWDPNLKTGRWVPCEHAQISCATDDYSASGFPNEKLFSPRTEFVKGSGTVADGYHITYGLAPADLLPAGCEVHMQVAEVDSAYNVRTIEFYEYTQEAAPGNRLVHIATRPPQEWNFNCFPSGNATLDPAVPCPISTARTAGFPQVAATYDVSGPTCYVNYPGSPVGTGGVWKANPATTEAGP